MGVKTSADRCLQAHKLMQHAQRQLCRFHALEDACSSRASGAAAFSCVVSSQESLDVQMQDAQRYQLPTCS